MLFHLVFSGTKATALAFLRRPLGAIAAVHRAEVFELTLSMHVCPMSPEVSLSTEAEIKTFRLGTLELAAGKDMTSDRVVFCG